MNKLAQFLINNPVDNIQAKVDLGGRLAGMEFTIKPITDTQIDEATNKASNFGKNKRPKQGVLYNEIILAGCVEPNFRDAELLEKQGLSNPEQFLNKYLLAGEKVDLGTEILKLSGYDEDEETVVVEEGKN